MNPFARVLLLAVLALSGCASVNQEARVKAATALIETQMAGYCSATYIGPRILLTASHCILVDSGPITINGRAGNIIAARHDGSDIAVLVVDIESPAWAKVGRRAKQGDKVFFYGHASGFDALLRRGYVVGFHESRTLVDMTVGKGDSGAGVFNERGELIGVVSSVFSAYPTFHICAVRQPDEGFL